VAYAAEILRGSPAYEITLFHVLAVPSRFSKDQTLDTWIDDVRLAQILKEGRDRWVENGRKRIEKEIFASAKQILRQKGIRENGTTIRTKVAAVDDRNVALAICQEAEAGAYDVVVLGSKQRSRLAELLRGSVAHKVARDFGGYKASGIWIVK
jgi:nucleotide-binding universal stress UspA family protein